METATLTLTDDERLTLGGALSLLIMQAEAARPEAAAAALISTVERIVADRVAAVERERDDFRDAAFRLKRRNVENAAKVRAVEALFAGGPDTPCRTTWHGTTECVEVPLDDLRAALA